MKKFLVFLLVAVVVYIACDYAKEGTSLRPDVKITYMNPIGWYTYVGDTTVVATIEEIHFVAENSVDCFLDRLVWEYYTEGGDVFFGPDEISLYGQIEGLVDPASVDTFILQNISLPLQPVRDNLGTGDAARALLHFYIVDEYWGDRYDTVTVWFGIYMMPQ
ncbi:hypothetical protein AMJ52_09075 [candidate division TA06 bacterium DG_78]|uniref:Uncharacterized protein n=1 Tax=candidate division TA06 bacterium DG_78 TaxID=1703772 RepID=A0A0S7Y924_UNCT6|nr:MAG: hypothetical protein AMJ52_09075 [candidate division TA06 bacterium DG_78]